MTTVTRWWWIRHAPVTGHGGRIYGQDDHAADCSDAVLFESLAAGLPADAVWVTTHLRRTRQTATALAAAIRAANGAADGMASDTDQPMPSPMVEPDLAEQHFGAWQGLTIEELKRRRDGAWHRFWLAPAHEAPPGGESFEQVVARVRAVIERLTAAHRGRHIVAVAHGGSIRAALAVALGIEAERALAFAIDNCSLTRLDHVGGPGDDALDGGSWGVTTVNLHPKAPLRR